MNTPESFLLHWKKILLKWGVILHIVAYLVNKSIYLKMLKKGNLFDLSNKTSKVSVNNWPGYVDYYSVKIDRSNAFPLLLDY